MPKPPKTEGDFALLRGDGECLNERSQPPRSLYDMHCHLDFALHAQGVAEDVGSRGISLLSTTVTPRGYEESVALFRAYPHVRVALGLHPWWIADGRCGAEDGVLFEQLMQSTSFVGEVGLDFGGSRAGAEASSMRETQVALFERIVARCAQQGEKVLSIHAVKSADTVLDVLERYGCTAKNVCIFHWFSGSSNDLQRALSRGCFFSVGKSMLSSKRGRAYAQAIPLERLLLETDAPSSPNTECSGAYFEDELQKALSVLAEIKQVSEDDLAHRIAQTSHDILSC